MKELSIEEKAKAYDETLQRTRRWYDSNTNEGFRGIFEDIFPELKESEDEKIRNKLIRIFRLYRNSDNRIDKTNWEGLKIDDVLAWLEKQGEQKPAEWRQDNVEELTEFENAMMHIGGSFFGENAGLNPNDTNAIKEQANLLLGLVLKQEWSEEDEDILNTIINHFEIDLECTENDDIIRWFKSIKDRYTWKPSDEQMNTLEQWLKDNQYKGDARYCYPIFESLYQDLKKLKE